MKKFFVVVSVLMALAFMAGPSNALIGVEDPVQGNSFRVPFLVAIGTTGLDTLVIYQNTDRTQGGTVALPTGVMSWIIWSPSSVHLSDGATRYSAGDVVPISVRDLIINATGPAGQAALEIDLDGDGVNDHWFGYMTNTNNLLVSNNIFAYWQLVDLANGQAAGTIATHYELANTNLGYVANQVSAVGNTQNFNHTGYVAPGIWEVMSPNAYAASYWRERGFAWNFAAPTFVRFTPRWYLHDALGQSYVMLYKSRNHVGVGVNATINVRFWNTDEFSLSGAIQVPNELSIINMRLVLPIAMYPAYPAAGWVDIMTPDILGIPLLQWDSLEWLCWVWNIAHSTTASTNWSALWVDKEVGTQ